MRDTDYAQLVFSLDAKWHSLLFRSQEIYQNHFYHLPLFFNAKDSVSLSLTLLVHSFSFFSHLPALFLSLLVHSFSFYLPPLSFFTCCSLFLSFSPLTYTFSLILLVHCFTSHLPPLFLSFSLSLSIGFLCSFIQCFKIMIKYIRLKTVKYQGGKIRTIAIKIFIERTKGNNIVVVRK